MKSTHKIYDKARDKRKYYFAAKLPKYFPLLRIPRAACVFLSSVFGTVFSVHELRHPCPPRVKLGVHVLPRDSAFSFFVMEKLKLLALFLLLLLLFVG